MAVVRFRPRLCVSSRVAFTAVVLSCTFLGAAAAQDVSRVLALRGALVHTAVGAPINNATILIRDGRFEAVGADVQVPTGVPVVDVTGMEIIPGMIDNHSHIGFDIRDVNERPVPFGPQHRIVDVLSPDDRYWNDAVQGGVTTVITGPGSGEVSSGQAAIVKTWGPSLDSRILEERGGIKIAMGRKSPEIPPHTSMAVTSLLRTQFIKAQEYEAARRRWEEGGRRGAPPARDLALETVARALNGEDRIRAHVHSAHDILSILRLKDEFGFELVLHHATEAYKVADEIARRNVSVVGLPLFVRIGLGEEVMASPAALTRAGIRFAFHTDDPVVHSKWQRYNGSLAIRYGMSPEDALRALTINGAVIAGVGDRVGSIEAGKHADFVVIRGPWYELQSRIESVYVEGVKAYDRTEVER